MIKSYQESDDSTIRRSPDNISNNSSSEADVSVKLKRTAFSVEYPS